MHTLPYGVTERRGAKSMRTANPSRARRKAIKRNAARHTEQTSTAIAPGYLNERAVSAYLGISMRTIQRWRLNGDGPPYYAFGPRRILYRQSDLDAWAITRRVGSTSAAAQLTN
jgi:predicted DNA-binding transcriptional regulator AlpA